MRMISKQQCPTQLTEWRLANQHDVNFGYKLLPSALYALVLESLISEQRGLCAYTGISVTVNSAHVEHIFPQNHCSKDEETRYENLAACVPAPNQKSKLPYGAQFKDSWPSAAEMQDFVSPYSHGCEKRFVFGIRGTMEAAPNDAAAAKTIEKLGLDHRALRERRLRSINAAIGAGRKTQLSLDAKAIRNRISKLKADEHGQGRLEEFCFMLVQVLPKRLKQVEAIRNSKRKPK